MKLVQPWTIGPLALLASTTIRWWVGASRFIYLAEDPAADPRIAPVRGIYLFWHENMLFPAYTHGRHGFSVLVSRHRDGQLIARILRMLGFGIVSGSTNRKGMSALRELMRSGKASHLAITPDGPQGPRRVVQEGAVYLASRTGMPIWPVGFAFRDCWRAGSWDRMVLPKPGTVGVCVAAPAIHLPPDLTMEQIEQECKRVQAEMDRVQARAEGRAAREK
jgi:lysophospholipid acyltransferase (LPLAT)-like uncharacterized protein